MSAPDAVARALAIAAVLDAGERAAEVLAAIPGPDGEAARAEAARLLAAPPEELAAAAAAARAPRPAGLAEIHPAWIEEALAGEDPRVRAIVAGGDATPEVRAWAERRVFGTLRPMPTGGGDKMSAPADLARARADWLTLRLERVGVRQLAHATAGAPPVELAALAARLGFVRGRAYVDAVTRVRGLGDDAVARLGPRRAAQARCETVRLTRDPMAFLAIGARATAPHVATVGGDLPWQIAQRMPPGPGRRVLEELLAHRDDRLDQAPAWAEIAT